MEREQSDFVTPDYNFDKPIKVSYVFEDEDSEETETFENSQLPENTLQYCSTINNNNTNSATELLNTTLSDQNCYNISFDDMENMENGLNIENDRSTNAERNSNRGVQNQHTVNSYTMSNPHTSLREIENVMNRSLNHLHLLNTVSENLIMIYEYYLFYKTEYVKDKNAIENYKNHKLHYYKQSYSATVVVLLPQEHNHEFIRNFIKRTIDIANHKSTYHNMTIRGFEILAYDLIQWAKREKYMEARKYNQLHQELSRQPPPSYSTASANIRRQQPMNIQAPVLLGLLEPRPPTSASNYCPASNTYTQVQQPLSGPPVAFLPSDLAVQAPSYGITDINIRHPTIGPPPISLPPSIPPQPPASRNFSNANPQQPKTGLPPISLVPTNQPVPWPPLNNSSNNSNINTRHQTNLRVNIRRERPMNMQTPVSLVPSVLSEPQATQSRFNIETRQQMTMASVSVLPVPSESNSIITNSTTNGGMPADHDNTVCLFSTGPPMSKVSINIDATMAKIFNDIEPSQKVRKSMHKGISKRRKTDDIKTPNILSTSSTLSPHNIQNQLQQNQNNQNQTPVTPNVYSFNTTMQPNVNFNQLCPGGRQNGKNDCGKCQSPLSRSESRDSGFGSPILSTSLTTSEYNTVYPHCTNQDLNPEIIHVTSMHPDAVFIANGACKICGTTTKNKCLVCYKEYYCGTKCQTADWPLHMQECRPR